MRQTFLESSFDVSEYGLNKYRKKKTIKQMITYKVTLETLCTKPEGLQIDSKGGEGGAGGFLHSH